MARMVGKTAIITGGGGGIGGAIGELFCREGGSVLLVDRDQKAVTQAVDRIRAQATHAQVESFVCDISDYGQVEGAVASAVERFGGVGVLVNNAAMRNVATIENTERKDWDALWSVNLVGAVNLCKAALGELRKNGSASVVNVSSVFGVIGRKDWGIYDATKAALNSFTRTLACEEAPNGIRANSICVASTLTPYTVERAQATRHINETELQNEFRTDNLLNRWAQPMEVAYPVLWLASEESSFITGATLMVDAGKSII